MHEVITEWLPFDAAQPKRKRAENVCLYCHSKKIKCDLQAKSTQGRGRCTNCETSGKDCQLRPSKRAKRQYRDGNTVGQTNRPLTPQTECADDAGHVPDFVEPNVVVHHTRVLDAGIRAPHLNGAEDRLSRLGRRSPGDYRSSSTLNQPPIGAPQHSHQIGPSPSQLSQRSTDSRSGLIEESHKGDIDTGFLQVYGPENEIDAQEQTFADSFHQKYPPSDPQQQDLIESYAETYWEYCYPWCPALDPDDLFDEVSRSPLLENALATAGSHIQPPLVPHQGPAEYYAKARTIFYNDEESDPLTTLKSIALFYWWAPRAPTTVHRHSSWWWTSVLIRHAQQMNLHREPLIAHPMRTEHILSVRRRIWWTAFARERLTALCQSKPAIIDPGDCNVQEPTLADFPSDPRFQRKGEIFIQWVRLCAIMGRVAKTLYRPGTENNASATTSQHIQELSNWINALPPHLQLPIQTSRTTHFDRDVHQLHLPYLTTVIILHLKRSAHPLPQALPPAILAASCIARILRDILARGNSRFLMAITCWYTGTAFIPLLQASHFPHLSKDANECLDILERTVEQLNTMWASANVIRGGFQRLRNTSEETSERVAQLGKQPTETQRAPATSARFSQVSDALLTTGGGSGTLPVQEDEFDWTTLFPFVTRETSSIADSILTGREQGVITRAFPSPENTLFHEALMTQFDDLFTIDGLDFMPTL